ncbi:MAG: ATP-binding protein [Candidatus Diapherotrites archaeon]|nr:ATP-binding protein [Candidatus Diapherotrites archaeon]
MRICITGGKGGTGKSLIATSLAYHLGKNHKVLLVDLDVDCPNDHLILSTKREVLKEVKQTIPVLNENRCKKCGICSNICRENAIVFIRKRFPIFLLDQCNGCKACMVACPANAIEEGERAYGVIYKGKNERIDMLVAELVPGQKEGSPLVHEAIKLVGENKKYDFVIMDTAAGMHCTVISALRECDYILAVTEPTPLGAHDLNLILDLIDELNIPSGVILNKRGIGNEKEVREITKRHGKKIVADVPYSKEVMEAYSKGIPVPIRFVEKLVSFVEEMK